MAIETAIFPAAVIDSINRRGYTRLPSCLRVDFAIVRLQGDLPGIDWQEGSTQDVSRGGIWLDTSRLNYHVFKFLKNNNIYLDLRIFVPLLPAPIKAVGEVTWFKETHGHYSIGLKFRSITKSNLNFIIRESVAFDWIIFLALAASTIFFASLVLWQLLVQLVNN